MKYDDLPITGSWWPYFDFTDETESNLVLLSALPAMRALNAAIFERRLRASSSYYFLTANEYYNIMKNAARGISIVQDLGIHAIYELYGWTRSLDSEIKFICPAYLDINADNYSEITPDDFNDCHYTFNTLLNKACDILDMEPIPDGNDQEMTPFFLKEYALQRYTMINLCKVTQSSSWRHKMSFFEGVSVDEFLHGTPEEDPDNARGWETWDALGPIDLYSWQLTQMFYYATPRLLYANCPCYEYYHVDYLNHDFGTGMTSGWNHRMTTGDTAGVFQFNRDIPPTGSTYYMNVDKSALLCDISPSLYFYTDVENP